MVRCTIEAVVRREGGPDEINSEMFLKARYIGQDEHQCRRKAIEDMYSKDYLVSSIRVVNRVTI